MENEMTITEMKITNGALEAISLHRQDFPDSYDLQVEIASELLFLRKMQEPCKWKEDEEGVYETGCDHSFFFDTGNATENKIKYCGFCGHPILDVPYAEESEDNDD
jgi:hypothetical protein